MSVNFAPLCGLFRIITRAIRWHRKGKHSFRDCWICKEKRTMVLSGKALLPAIILFGSMMVAAMYLRQRGAVLVRLYCRRMLLTNKYECEFAFSTSLLMLSKLWRYPQNQTNMVARPMIGDINTINREGPWPECSGIPSQECVELINKSTGSRVEIEFSSPGEETHGFNPERVIIVIDASDVVTNIPHKG